MLSVFCGAESPFLLGFSLFVCGLYISLVPFSRFLNGSYY